MRHHQERDTFFSVHFLNRPDHDILDRGMDSSKGLIEQIKPKGLSHKTTDNLEQHALSPGKIPGRFVAQSPQETKIKKFIGPMARLPLAGALGERGDEHVFKNSHVSEQACHLEGTHDPLMGNTFWRPSVNPFL